MDKINPENFIEIERINEKAEKFIILQDGRLACATGWCIKVYNPKKDFHLDIKLEEDAKRVETLCQIEDGHIIAGDVDQWIRVWDLKTKSIELAIKNAHDDRVISMVNLSKNCFASGLRDSSHIQKNQSSH